MKRLISVLLCFVVNSAVSPASADRTIVEDSQGKVTYAMIHCAPAMLVDNALRCHDEEQKKLDRVLAARWIEQAASLNGVSVTPTDEIEVRHIVERLHPQTAEAAKHFRDVLDAVVRIREGVPKDRAVAEAAREGVRAEDIDTELAWLPDIASAKAAAAKDFVKEGDERNAQSARLRILAGKLEKLVAARAEHNHVAFEVAEEQFWNEVLNRVHTRVIDDSYRLRERKGVLRPHVERIALSH